MTESTFPTVISFYTPSWEYASHAARLKSECDALGLDHHIKEYPNTGDWLSNTRYKASFVHDTLVELHRPVLWIDVDGSILRQPSLLSLPTKLDFMGRHQRTGPKRTWHVGTLFFNYNKNTVELTRLWKEAALNASGSDEAEFENIWLQNHVRLGLTYIELPHEYFTIIKHNEAPSPDVVICHRLSTCESKMEMKRRNAEKK